MKKTDTIFRSVAMALAVVGMVSFAACAKKPKPEETSVPSGPTVTTTDENEMGDSDSNKAMGLKTVHFPYDSFVLDSEAKALVKSNADIINGKTGLKVQIEGHCDQRGGIQYNIALGEKRANATKAYLVDLGVNADRITTISYGKERPIDPAMTDAAYAKNRRANFVITAK